MKPEHKIYISVLLIIILGFVVYGNSLKGEFIWDDLNLVKNNTYIRSWSNIPKVFTSHIGAGTLTEEKYIFYRPLQMLTYMFDYSIWELNVIGYHLTGIILHIFVALAIFWFINILYDNKILSTIAALFFVIHPVHTMVVNEISARAELLYLLFLLLTFIFYIKSLRSKNIISYIFMLTAYSLSLLSKEASLILPALLLLYHYTFKEKIKAKEFVSILCVIGAYLILRTNVMGSAVISGVHNVTLFERLPGTFVAITNYIRLLFLPFGLHKGYGHPLFKLSNPQAISGLAILVFLLFYIFKTRKTDKIIFFSISWFLISLVPVSNIYTLNAYMSENWLYLPSIGFFVVVANGLCQVLTVLNKKHLAHKLAPGTIIILTILIAFYSYLTIKQNNYWREPIRFYERTLKYTPKDSRILNNLGNIYKDKKEYEKAIDLYKQAIAIDGRYIGTYYNLANIYRDIEQYEKAIPLYKKIIEISPDRADAHNALGVMYIRLGRVEDSLEPFKKAVEIEPKNAIAHKNLAVVYFNLGQFDLAIKHCDKAIELGYIDREIIELLKPYRR